MQTSQSGTLRSHTGISKSHAGTSRSLPGTCNSLPEISRLGLAYYDFWWQNRLFKRELLGELTGVSQVLLEILRVVIECD
jgi:hypothetical protein